MLSRNILKMEQIVFLALHFIVKFCHAQALLHISKMLWDKFYEGNLRNEKRGVCLYEHEVLSLTGLLVELKSKTCHIKLFFGKLYFLSCHSLLAL